MAEFKLGSWRFRTSPKLSFSLGRGHPSDKEVKRKQTLGAFQSSPSLGSKLGQVLGSLFRQVGSVYCMEDGFTIAH